jgi:hypothetical protein
VKTCCQRTETEGIRSLRQNAHQEQNEQEYKRQTKVLSKQSLFRHQHGAKTDPFVIKHERIDWMYLSPVNNKEN